jgi:hypothetical protein
MERYMRGISSRECDMAKVFFRSTEINIRGSLLETKKKGRALIYT